MHALKMCFNPKVLGVLGVVAAWLFVFQPDVALAALPFLIAVACPISMIVMAGIMGREQHQGVAAGAGGDGQYTCPMHPNVTRPAPGNCPACGMALAPAAAPPATAAAPDVGLSRDERLAELQAQLEQVQAQQERLAKEIGRLQAAGTPSAAVAGPEPVVQAAIPESDDNAPAQPARVS